MFQLETERLIIRDNILEDLEAHHMLMSNPEVMSYIQDIQTHSYEASKANLMFSIEASKKVPRIFYFFAMIHKETKEHIGSVGMTILEKGDSGNAELGYFIHKKYWGHGYTSEAAKAVIDYAFDELGIYKITTGCVYENHRSEKIMKKLGMFKESHLYHHTYHEGRWKERVTYGHYNLRLLDKASKQWLVIVKMADLFRNIHYHFDGSTAVFIHGVDIEMDDVDVVFPADHEETVRELLKDYSLTETIKLSDMVHFSCDVDGEKLHCLFYKDDSKFHDYETMTYRHFVPIRYKGVEFYKRHSDNETVKEKLEEFERRR